MGLVWSFFLMAKVGKKNENNGKLAVLCGYLQNYSSMFWHENLIPSKDAVKKWMNHTVLRCVHLTVRCGEVWSGIWRNLHWSPGWLFRPRTSGFSPAGCILAALANHLKVTKPPLSQFMSILSSSVSSQSFHFELYIDCIHTSYMCIKSLVCIYIYT